MSERKLTDNNDLYGIFRVLNIKPNTKPSRMNHEHFGLLIESETLETDYKYYHEKLDLKIGKVFHEGAISEDCYGTITHFRNNGECIYYERREKYFVFMVNLLDRDWWIKENDFKGYIDEGSKTYEKLYEKCISYYEAQNQEFLLMPSMTIELFAGGFFKKCNYSERYTLIFSLRANFLAEKSRRSANE